MENTINEKLLGLTPYLGAIIYENIYPTLHVNIPVSWSYKNLTERDLILDSILTPNGVFNKVIIGFKIGLTELSVDVLINELEEVISFNKKEERKQKLLQEKILAMQKLSLEEIEELDLPELSEDDKKQLTEIQSANNIIKPLNLSTSGQVVEFEPLYQKKGSNLINADEVLPKKMMTNDGIEYKPYIEDNFNQPVEEVINDPRIMNYDLPNTLNREKDEVIDESLDNGIKYNPMPDSDNNI